MSKAVAPATFGGGWRLRDPSPPRAARLDPVTGAWAATPRWTFFTTDPPLLAWVHRPQHPHQLKKLLVPLTSPVGVVGTMAGPDAPAPYGMRCPR